jgi:hypothetical protein
MEPNLVFKLGPKFLEFEEICQKSNQKVLEMERIKLKSSYEKPRLKQIQ